MEGNVLRIRRTSYIATVSLDLLGVHAKKVNSSFVPESQFKHFITNIGVKWIILL